MCVTTGWNMGVSGMVKKWGAMLPMKKETIITFCGKNEKDLISSYNRWMN